MEVWSLNCNGDANEFKCCLGRRKHVFQQKTWRHWHKGGAHGKQVLVAATCVKQQLKYWNITYLVKTWRVHTKPTILDHFPLYPETFIGSCGFFQILKASIYPCCTDSQQPTPWPSWISCWQSWSFECQVMRIGRLTASKCPQFVCCLLKMILYQYLLRQCGETIHKNRLHLLSIDPRSSIDGSPISDQFPMDGYNFPTNFQTGTMNTCFLNVAGERLEIRLGLPNHYP